MLLLIKFQSDEIVSQQCWRRGQYYRRDQGNIGMESKIGLSAFERIERSTPVGRCRNYATCTRPLDYIIACGYMRTKHSRVRRFEGRLESRSRKKNRSKLPCCHTGVVKRVVARSTSSSNYFRKRKCITTDHLFPRLLLHEGIRGDGWINLRIETFRREIENWKTVLRLYRFYQI